MSRDDLEQKLPFRSGSLIAKKYRVEKLLAAGGMGAVLKAQHETLDQPVAIKVMRPELADRPEAAQRFLREARAAAKIASDYVARVTDVDVLEDRTPFMVMEYLEGRDLDALLEAEVRLPIALAADLAIQALAGLEAAHALGVVHRDLKPSNLFLVERKGAPARIKVLDFGISKVIDETQDRKLKAGATTSAGAMLGTPRYMSPEQVASAKSVDTRTDLWAMGLILYEMLAGVYPFGGDNSGELLAAILSNPVAPLREHRPDAPQALEAVVQKALEKRRESRFQTAREMIRALAPFASPRGQALVADLEHAPSVAPAGLTRPRTPEGTLRSADPASGESDPQAPTARDPAAYPGAATAATRVEGAASPAPAPNLEIATAPTKLSSMRPAVARSSPTDSNMIVGRRAPSASRWVVSAIVVALGLAALGSWWLFAGPDKGGASRAPTTQPPAASPAATGAPEARAQEPIVAVQTNTPVEPSSLVVTPSASSPASATKPADPLVPLKPQGTTTDRAATAGTKPGAPPAPSAKSTKGLLDSRD